MVDLPVNSVVDGIQFHSGTRRQNRRCQTNGQTQTCVSRTGRRRKANHFRRAKKGGARR